MNLKVVSCKRILSRIQRVFKPTTTSWIDESIESIGDGLRIIGYCAGYSRTTATINISDFKGVLPCDIESLEAVSYNDMKLLPNDAFIYYENQNCNFPKGCINNHWYLINSTFIKTSFECGKLNIYYLSIPVDEDGFPLVPDNVMCETALGWIVMRDLIAGGLKHSQFNYEFCDSQWEKYYPQAQNDMNFPSISNLELHGKRWNRAIKSHNYNEVFYGKQDNNTRVNTVIDRADTGATIIKVNDTDNDLTISQPF